LSLIPGTLATNKGVRTLHAGYNDSAVLWKRCRDVIAGSDAVKGQRTLYLPKLTNQAETKYREYLLRTNFFNATARTMEAMLGMLFRKVPSIVVPTITETLLPDVTADGTNFEVFVRDVAEEVVSVGRAGILVDCPPAPEVGDKVITVADAQQLGMRPFMQLYCAESIINWKHRKINNKMMLSMVVLSEPTETNVNPNNPNETPDEFATYIETQYRVLDLDENNLYRVRMFRINKQNQDELISTVYPIMDGKPMQEIPFIFLDPDGTEPDFDEPPLLDLVDVNLSHYRTNADYEHGCHFTALPTLFLAGVANFDANGNAIKIALGSQNAIIAPNPEAKASFVEFTGQGLLALENNMDRKEAMMAVLGARMLEPQKKAAETATTSAIHRVGENSALASISIAVSLAILQALKWFSYWAGDAITDDSIKFEINRDYLPVAIDGPTLTAYLGAYQAGTLRLEDIFDLFQRADLIEGEVDYDEFNTQVQSELQAKQESAIALAQATKPIVGNDKPPVDK
jgi:hypothetical protein